MQEQLIRLVSIIIVSRSEEYLNATIQNLIETAQTEIEIIVVLDGPPIEAVITHPKVPIRIINHEVSQGRRPSTNEACKLANGKYFFHLDAHCKTDVIGWDQKFIALCQHFNDRAMIIPNLDALDVKTWTNRGRRMGHKYITVRMKDGWSGIKPTQEYEETICGNGMGWFIPRDYFWSFGGCDTEHLSAIWGSFGLEWALKVWLSDPDGKGLGRVILAKDIVFGHMWKNEGTGYSTPGASGNRRWLRCWVDGTGPKQVRPFEFFETHLKHLLPQKFRDTKRPLLINEPYPQITAIMNTNGLYPELIEEAIESFRRQTYPNKKLLIVSTNPHVKLAKLRHRGAKDDDGGGVPDSEASAENVSIEYVKPFKRFPEQIAHAIKRVDSPYWCVMDSDDIFASWHLEQLMQEMQAAKKEGLEQPGYVIIPRAIEQWKGHQMKQRNRGWWCCLYERVQPELVDEALRVFLAKSQKDTGFDLHFIKRPWWHVSERAGERTRISVLHRLGVDFHIRNEHQHPGYYKQSLDKVRDYTPPVLNPRWLQNYDETIKSFDEPAVTIMIMTFGRNIEQLQFALQSAAKQSYPNTQILLGWNRPDHCFLSDRIANLTVYTNSELSRSDLSGLEFRKKLFEQIKTPLFCILDDDDTIDVDHVTSLVRHYLVHRHSILKRQFFKKRYVEKSNALDYQSTLKAMWWNCLFETEVLRKDDSFAKVIGNNLQAYDKRILEFVKPIAVDSLPTYIWDQTQLQGQHESQSEANTHDEKLARIKDLKREAFSRVNPIVPCRSLNPFNDELPEVTLLMATYGAHKSLTEEAIASFLAQTYPRKRLIILNTHIEPIILAEAQPEIAIIERPNDPFVTLPVKFEFLLTQNTSPLWGILDDDDILLPWHIESLVNGFLAARKTYVLKKPKHRRPIMIGHERKIVLYEDRVGFIKRGAGWTCRLFEKIDAKAICRLLSAPSKFSYWDCDNRITHARTFWHLVTLDYPTLPGYMWRAYTKRKENDNSLGDTEYFSHLSTAGQEDECFVQRYALARQRANRCTNLGEWQPQLRQDYAELLSEFLAQNDTQRIFDANAIYFLLNKDYSISQNEWNFLRSHIERLKCHSLAEFGSGASTRYLGMLNIPLHTYETDTFYGERVKLFLPPHVEMSFYQPGEHIQIAPDCDFIFIDGPNPVGKRASSFESALASSARYVAVHDTYRPEIGFAIQVYLANWKVVAKIDPKLNEKTYGTTIFKRPK